MITGEECLVSIEVDKLDNLPKQLEDTDQPSSKRNIGDVKKEVNEQELVNKTVRRVLVPGRGGSKRKRQEGSMVVRSLDNIVVRVMSPAKRDRDTMVWTKDGGAETSNKRAKQKFN